MEGMPGNRVEVDATLDFCKGFGELACAGQVKRILLVNRRGIWIQFEGTVELRLCRCPVSIQRHRRIGELGMTLRQGVI